MGGRYYLCKLIGRGSGGGQERFYEQSDSCPFRILDRRGEINGQMGNAITGTDTPGQTKTHKEPGTILVRK